MPTSATGMGREAGFTLVELMVVLFIMGLVSAVVVLSLPADDGADLRREAGAFAARLKHAQEEAVLTNRTVQVAVDAGGYRFAALHGRRWAALDDGPFRARPWATGVTVTASGAVRFDPTGGAEPARVTLSRKGRVAEVTVSGEGRVSVDAPRG